MATAAAASAAGEPLAAALQHLASGKRNLLVQDVPAAVTEFAEASRILGEIYGETGVECAEAYFNYGKALLELARMESGVIESVPDGEDSAENSTEEEEDEEEEESADAKSKEEAKTEEGIAESDEKAAGKSEAAQNGDKDPEKEKSDEKDENESIGSNEAGTSVAKDSKDQTEIDQEELEDPSNLQLSWEMLELAKSLLQKHADSLPADDHKRMELEAKLSETYQILGELSIENENYAQAVEDLTCCLRRRQELLPEDSRCIAETHYQMGVALGFNLEFERAIGSLNDAIYVLEKRIENLKNEKESEDPSVKKDAFYTRDREITEISSLLPEIREKIADTKDMQEETFKKLGDRVHLEGRELEAISQEGFSLVDEREGGVISKGSDNLNGHSNASPTKAADKPTSDITHMIKKRKREEDDSSAAKKSNMTANGSSA